jgi:hypothetical protein
MSIAHEIFDRIRDGETAEITPKVTQLLTEAQHDSNCHAPTVQIHPLGFLCLRWDLDASNSLRIHIWDKKFSCVQSPNWPIHDHIFSFRSLVILGAIQNKTYRKTNTSERKQWNIFEVVYDGGNSKLVWTGIKTAIAQERTDLQVPGSYYDVVAGQLHRSTLRSDFAVTVLATTKDISKETHPQVVGGDSTHALVFNRYAGEKPSAGMLIRKSIELLIAQAPGLGDHQIN